MLHEGGDAGDALADYELVDVVGAFVGGDAFEVVHVAHDAVVVDDAVGAENVAGFASGVEGDGDIVHLQHGDVGRVDFVFIFEAANVQGQELPLHDFGDHPGEFFLDELVRGDGLVGELFGRLGVLQCGVVAGHGGAERAPAYAVSRLIEATERAFQSDYVRQQIFRGDFAIGKRQAGGYRRAQRPFTVDVPGFEAGSSFFHEEAANLFVFAFGPYNGDICDGAAGNPHFFAV